MRLLSLTFALLCSAQVLLAQPEKELEKANEMYKNLVSEHIPDIPEANIIIEPAAKNTAPCIGLAAIHIAKKDINSKKGKIKNE